jgi:hypothetical protein
MLLRVSAMPVLPSPLDRYAVSLFSASFFRCSHAVIHTTVSYSLEVSRFGQCVLSYDCYSHLDAVRHLKLNNLRYDCTIWYTRL